MIKYGFGLMKTHSLLTKLSLNSNDKTSLIVCYLFNVNERKQKCFILFDFLFASTFFPLRNLN